ncbi:uncharacterized protein LOC128342697 [Hemicordylus capensis]|uniref:uncharacterized protein LOC128342697 n=1 Tax=Hemicordylus capensis TaxID=884348 RepID=UPI00230318D4|nr:uncharacterized protein LOC128342697 [Hemicordylus capensis]
MSRKNQKPFRGQAWRAKETLDLLDIWGKEVIQDQLRSCYSNIEVFKYIANKMAERGHQRNAEQCRSKTKCLRQQYKNSDSGKTCKYYKQLHEILKGDPSVQPKPAVAPSLEPQHSLIAQPGPQELFTPARVTISMDLPSRANELAQPSTSTSQPPPANLQSRVNNAAPQTTMPRAVLPLATRRAPIRRTKKKTTGRTDETLQASVRQVARTAARASEDIKEVLALTQENGRKMATALEGLSASINELKAAFQRSVGGRGPSLLLYPH